MCASLAPGAFALLDSGVAGVLPGAATCPLEQLMKAAKSCPTQCITLYKDDEEVNLY
jgi:ferredoxin